MDRQVVGDPAAAWTGRRSLRWTFRWSMFECSISARIFLVIIKNENKLDVMPSIFAPCQADSIEGTSSIRHLLYNLLGALPQVLTVPSGIPFLFGSLKYHINSAAQTASMLLKVVSGR